MNSYSDPAERKRQRQSLVLELVAREPLGTQQEIARALKRRGVRATQVSVSRDLAELGLVKAGGRYVPGGTAAAAPASDPLTAFVRSAAAAGPNMVVLRCETGSAPRVGLALDQGAWPGVVGTIAGDDTVFVAAASAAEAARLIRLISARLSRPR
ncbi:hypothetical protein EPO15_12840 [bacterium]|nr:MAG: hypothetical protein EPO15_12840 [bacterium]